MSFLHQPASATTSALVRYTLLVRWFSSSLLLGSFILVVKSPPAWPRYLLWEDSIEDPRPVETPTNEKLFFLSTPTSNLSQA